MFIYPRLHLGPWFCCISKKTHNQTLKSSSEVTNESLGANQSLVHLVGALEQSFFLPSSLLDRMRKLAKQNKMSLCCLQGDSACRLWLLCAAGFPFFFFFRAHLMEKIYKFAQGHFFSFSTPALCLLCEPLEAYLTCCVVKK